MKRLSVILIFTCFVFVAMAQSEETEKRLTALRFRAHTPASPAGLPGGFLDLTLMGKRLAVGSTQFGDKAYLGTNLNANEDLNFRINFLNPLVYRVSVKLTEKDDPSAAAFDGFLKQMSGTFGNVVELSTFNPGARPGISPPRAIIPSVILKDFLFATGNALYVKAAYYNKVRTLASEVESFLYGDIKNVCDCRSEGNVLAIISNAVIDLSKKTDFAEFDTASKDLNDNLKNQVSDSNAKVKKKLEELRELVKDAKAQVITNPPTWPDKPTFEAALESYAQATEKWIDIYTRKDVQEISTRITAFASLIEGLRKFVDQKKATRFVSNNFIPYGSQKLARKKDIGVNVNIITIKLGEDLTPTPVDTIDLSFTVIKNKPQLEIAAGVALLPAPYTFNNFFIDDNDGSPVIGNTTTTKVVLPTLFLNYYVHVRQWDMDFILPQLGVTTGKEYPSLLVGVGITEFNRFSLTTGAAVLFNQRLHNSYYVGAPLENEDVVKDVTKAYYNEPDLSWYISLNYRLTK